MPGLRGAVVAECDLAGADVGRLVGLGVDEAALGLTEWHGLAHAEAGPCYVVALLDRECQEDEIKSTILKMPLTNFDP